MTLPEIATELRNLSALLGEPRLADLADEMRRRIPRRLAPNSSTRMTAGLRLAIRSYALHNPTLSQAAIARISSTVTVRPSS